MKRRAFLAVFLIVIGIAGFVAVSTVHLTPTYTGPALSPYPATPAAPGPYRPQQLAPTSIDEAAELARGYLASLGYSDLDIKEIMEFQYNYYFIAYEKSTGIGAFEGVIEKEISLSGMGWMMGIVHPEQGPSMMWNTKYGHMAGWGRMGGMMDGRWWGYRPRPYSDIPTVEMPVTASDAEQIAQAYLDSYLPGSTIEHPDTFYGYYTVHVLRDGKVYGMLSVNGYTGQVWYHTWHGAFIQMKELT
ncbi:PepSY domain-containing protein [Candidatus Bathyarchaeota archaeon]|nr:PepSY domain-containing protein [Candidatus Bathyarchaeota archaeon]